MDSKSRILIVGHGGAIEKGLTAHFKKNDYQHVYSVTEMGLNTTIQSSVQAFFQDVRPEYVFLNSIKCGGIQANIDRPAEFIYENLMSQNNCLYAAYKFKAKKMLYYGGSCVYPKAAAQPIKENALLTGALEETSAPYSTAKIAGILAAQSFKKQYGFDVVTMVPATVYGPGADTELASAHVLGALIAKFSDAIKDGSHSVTVWGSGNPRREFIYVDDLVEASLFLMNNYSGTEAVNAGSGTDVSIKELAELIARVVGYDGDVQYDTSKPDGVAQKLLDSSYMSQLGFSTQVSLQQGIERTYKWYAEKEA